MVGRASAGATHREHARWIGIILRSRRRVLAGTLTRMGTRTGFSAGRLCELENGQRLPHVRTLRKLARAYGLPVGLLRLIRNSVFYSGNLACSRRELGTAGQKLRAAVLKHSTCQKRQAEAQRALRGARLFLDRTQRL